jgi:hypothetical protein
MPAIYTNASKVLAYIGEATECSDIIFDALADLRYDEKLLAHKLPSSPELAGAGLNDILARRWFTRVWCLQEIALAQSVEICCGAKFLGWDRLLLADIGYYCLRRDGSLAPLNKNPHRDSSYMNRILSGRLDHDLRGIQHFPLILRLPMNRKHSFQSLYTLLEEARLSCSAGDPRDMIYALLGMFEGHQLDNMQPNYELAVRDVYHEVSELLIESHQCLDLVGQAWARGSKDFNLASWAIDWTAKQQPYDYTFWPDLKRREEWISARVRLKKRQFRFTSVVCNSSDSQFIQRKRVLIAVGSKRGRVFATRFPKTESHADNEEDRMEQSHAPMGL